MINSQVNACTTLHVQVKQTQFDLDYSRVATKPLFCKLLSRIDEVICFLWSAQTVMQAVMRTKIV
jgi:hypothetical protein